MGILLGNFVRIVVIRVKLFWFHDKDWRDNRVKWPIYIAKRSVISDYVIGDFPPITQNCLPQIILRLILTLLGTNLTIVTPEVGAKILWPNVSTHWFINLVHISIRISCLFGAFTFQLNATARVNWFIKFHRPWCPLIRPWRFLRLVFSYKSGFYHKHGIVLEWKTLVESNQTRDAPCARTEKQATKFSAQWDKFVHTCEGLQKTDLNMWKLLAPRLRILISNTILFWASGI